MRQQENIEALTALGPDYMGFIFYSKSPRFAGGFLTPKIIKQIPESIKKTGVFVNLKNQDILEICKNLSLNTVQLHGKESPEQCRAIKNLGLEVIKAFSLNSMEEIDQIMAYEEVCDYFLFDTPTRKYGGSGKKFDWSLLKALPSEKPFFLSGGIEENDAETLIEDCPVSPFAVDINSKFEIEPGLKNIESIERFIKTIRKQS
ncbi:phosphoribosylanthranilate isomerase [Marinilabilia rubra]|nr:phosphoribosylanthranilate isomerase [Marinilabilia rubra]